MVRYNEILNKYYNDYIDGVSIDNIEFKTFTYDELQEFFKVNYFDKDLNQIAFWIDDGCIRPYGMHYLELSYPYKDNYYLLGLVDNNVGGKTIVFCMEYDKSYQLPCDEEKEISYIIFVETNYFFRNKGVLKKALEYIKKEFINCSHLTMTSLSDDGQRVDLFQRIEELFKDTDVSVENSDYIYSLTKRKK